MIDQDGFRENVGIIIINQRGEVLWARRFGTQNAWQFPQGGIDGNESPIDAMYRELTEELGILPNEVTLLAESMHWIRYRLPKQYRRRDDPQSCIGQKQKWFLLQLTNGDHCVRLNASHPQEFDAWKWVDYWLPLQEVIFFKKNVYRKVLQEFSIAVKKTLANDDN